MKSAGTALFALMSFIAAALFAPAVAPAQIPSVLRHSIQAPPHLQAGGAFGISVAADGNYVVVGASSDDSIGADTGIVKIYDATTGALLHVLNDPTPASLDSFGTSVSISGTLVVVGANGDDAGTSNAGSAYVYDLGSGTPTVPVFTLNNPSSAQNDNFGNAVAISGSYVVVGAYLDDAGATDAGSAYVYNLAGGTPTVPVTSLNNPDPLASDQFGKVVAISGTRVVVGAWFDDTGAANAGSAYVYDVSGGTPDVPIATLSNPAAAAGDVFGGSVAISGDRVVVAAYSDDAGANDTGTVYVYDFSGGPTTVPSLTISNPFIATGDSFGSGLCLVGSKLMVGAYTDGAAGPTTGSAYVFDLSSGTPAVPTTSLANPAPALQDRFGVAVAIVGTKVVVGANADDAGATDAGSAYIYDLVSGTPTVPVFTLNDPGLAVGDHFGNATAVSGSYLVVGASLNDTNGTDSGSVFIYDLASATPAVPAFTLVSPNVGVSGRFGNAVAISGTRVAVAAYFDNTGASSAGSVYVYDLTSGTPTVPVFTLNNPTPAAGDNFGWSVAISGARVVVGTLLDDTAATDAGSVYVYDLMGGTPTVPAFTLINPDPTASDFFGNAVAIDGDDVAVGTYFDDTGAANTGSVYVYDLGSGTPTVSVVTLNNPGPAASENFGSSVAVSGGRVVVGARVEGTGATGAGSAYVYDINSGTPSVPVVTLNNPTPATSDNFASAVSISGSLVVVGAPNDDTSATDSGIAYVYNVSSGTPTVPVATLTNPGPVASDSFGSSVSISGTTVAISKPLFDLPALDQGAVCVFAPPSTNAALANIVLSEGGLAPLFASGTLDYTASVGNGTTSITLTPTLSDPNASVKVNNVAVASGSPSGAIAIGNGLNVITVVVTAEDNVAAQTYTVTVERSGKLKLDDTVFIVNSGPLATTADIIINRTGSLAGAVSGTLSTSNGTAIAPAQYTAQASTPVNFASTVSVQHVLIPIAANATTTTAKTFTVTLADPGGGVTLDQPTTATVVILPPASATDAAKPAVVISAPINNVVLHDALLAVVSGTASDNIGVRKVQVSVDNGVNYSDAVLTAFGATSTGFSFELIPGPGPNSVKVRAIDFKGNISAVAVRTFSLLNTLNVAVSGPADSGSVTAGFVPTSFRQVGKSVTIKATPKAGFVFDGWTANSFAGTGVTVASAELPALTFTMQKELSLTAHFIANPFTDALVGKYNGLVTPSATVPAVTGTVSRLDTVGMVQNLAVSKTGNFTSMLKIDGLSRPVPGKFDNAGVARFGPSRAKVYSVARLGKPSLDVALQLDMSGVTKKVTGTVDQTYRGAVIARSTVDADRAHYSASNKAPSNLAGTATKAYTLVFPSKVQTSGLAAPYYPQGDGYATMTVKVDGTVTINGKLADHTAILASAPLSAANQWPIFAQLYALKGSFAGMAALNDAMIDTDVTGTNLRWFRPYQAVQWYPFGWEDGINVDLLGSKYVVPPASPPTSVFPGLQSITPNATLLITNGLLTSPFTRDLTISPTNVATNVPVAASPVLTLTKATGLIGGSFIHTDLTKPTFQGVILQKGANGGARGYFMTVAPKPVNFLGESGKVKVTAK